MADAAIGEPQQNTTASMYRNSAQWMLMAFAAIGAVITASLTIGQLSSTDGNGWLIFLALLGYVGAMAGVSIAIGANANLIAPATYTLQEVRDGSDYGQSNPDVFGTYGSAKGVDDERKKALEDIKNAPNSTDREAAEAAYRSANDVLMSYMQFKALAVLQTRYASSIRLIKWGAGLTALGVALFAGAVSWPSALDTREAAVTKKEAELTKGQAELAVQKADSAVKASEFLPADKARLDALLKREKAVLDREQAVQGRELKSARAAMQAMPLLGYPVDGIWKPSADSSECKGVESVKVRVLGVALVPKSENDETLTPVTTLVTLSPAQCAGRLVEVNANEGPITLRMISLELTDKVKTITDTAGN